MATPEYCRCPPRVPTPAGAQVAIASGIPTGRRRRGRRGHDRRRPSSRRGTWSCTWDRFSNSSLQVWSLRTEDRESESGKSQAPGFMHQRRVKGLRLTDGTVRAHRGKVPTGSAAPRPWVSRTSRAHSPTASRHPPPAEGLMPAAPAYRGAALGRRSPTDRPRASRAPGATPVGTRT
jgi:hypothetical protein